MYLEFPFRPNVAKDGLVWHSHNAEVSAVAVLGTVGKLLVKVFDFSAMVYSSVELGVI